MIVIAAIQLPPFLDTYPVCNYASTTVSVIMCMSAGRQHD